MPLQLTRAEPRSGKLKEAAEPHSIATPPSTWSAPFACVAVGLAGAVLTTLGYLLGSDRSFTHDGGTTVMFVIADRPWGDILSGGEATYNNHPIASLLGQLTWRLGGTSEVMLRLVSAVAAGSACGLVGWFSAKKWDAAVGLTAVFAMAMNPLFIANSRAVRGYSLSVLGVVAATVILLHLLSQADRRPGKVALLHGLYVLAIGLAVGAHAYGGIVAVAHVAYLLATEVQVLPWLKRIIAGLSVGGLFYAVMIPQFFEGNGRLFRPLLPVALVFEFGGLSLPSIIILWTGVVLTLTAIFKRRPLRQAFLASTALLFAVWAVVAPFDLYPRMFLSLLPAFAIMAAVGLRGLGPVAPALVFAALAWSGAPNLATWSSDPMPNRLSAGIAEAAAAEGATVCGTGWITNSIRLYTTQLTISEDPEVLEGCDLVLGFQGDPNTTGLTTALGHQATLNGWGPVSLWWTSSYDHVVKGPIDEHNS